MSPAACSAVAVYSAFFDLEVEPLQKAIIRYIFA